MEVEEAYEVLVGRSPWQHQRKCWELLGDDSISGITLLSGTGSGKTEAILIPSLVKDKRLVMIYPTRSLVNDQVQRAKKYCRKLIINDAKSRTVIVDTGDEEYALQYSGFDKNSLSRIVGQIAYWHRINRLKEIKVLSDKNRIEERVELNELQHHLEGQAGKMQDFELIYEVGPRTTIRFSEVHEHSNYVVRKSRKHYLGGDIILTTIDKFLYRFFGYGEHKWNLIYPYRLYMGKLVTERLVVCFDEAHSYNSVSYTNFVNLLSALVGNNIKVVVMSATLPEKFLELMKAKLGMTTVNGDDHKGQKTYSLIDTDDRDGKIREIIDHNIGKRIIIVRNTVGSAFRIYEQLKGTSDDNASHKSMPLLFYHGRLFSFVKSQVYSRLKEKEDANEPYILITTHAIEVGCDLNAEVLATDYCNPDQLVQRAGRCARKKGSTGTLFVLGRRFQENVDDYLKDEEAYDYENYIKLLEEHNGDSLPEETIRRQTIRHSLRKEELTDALFHFLYSYVYEFDRAREELHKSGILSTRSWIPSAKVFWVKRELSLDEVRVWAKEMNFRDMIAKIGERGLLYNYDPLSISIDMLSTHDTLKGAELEQDYLVFAVHDSEREDGYVKGRINPYLSDLYVLYKSSGYPNINPLDGMIQLPKIFEEKAKRRGIKRVMIIKKQILSDSKYDNPIEFLYIA